jgi:acyl-CoA synthetase (AMP-forming)/AMP-acid ligase II
MLEGTVTAALRAGASPSRLEEIGVEQLCDRPGVVTIADVLADRVSERGARTVFSFVDTRENESAVTYAELDGDARRVAGGLLERGASGRPVLLLFPPGLDFVTAFLGCVYAGAVAVPAHPPRRNRTVDRLLSIIGSCGCELVLTNGPIEELARDCLGRESVGRRLEITEISSFSATPVERPRDCRPGDLAFLQYTSGSTASRHGEPPEPAS